MKADPSSVLYGKRVVVDTNVWISAALSPSGAPSQVVQFVLRVGLPVFSAATFAELEERLWRPKFDRYLSLETRRLLLHDVNAASWWTEVPVEIAAVQYSRDPDDDKFIHAALAAQAPFLITGDQDLLTVPSIKGLRILSPAEMLRVYTGSTKNPASATTIPMRSE